MSRYARMFQELAGRSEGAFVPFVMLGDPDPALSARVLRALVEGGADALELGIPFSDPVADGPTIQAAAQRALAAGVTPQDCWRLLAGLRESAPDLPVGLLVYANLVVNRGLDHFYGRAAEAGVDSVLVADVPTLEAQPFVDGALEHDVDPVFIAPLNAGEERIAQIARFTRGYTYVVTRSGVTGADAEVRLAHDRLLAALAAHGAPPPVFGFGISRPEHVVQALRSGAAGAISGSAVVAHVDQDRSPETLLPALTGFVSRMKAATRDVQR